MRIYPHFLHLIGPSQEYSFCIITPGVVPRGALPRDGGHQAHCRQHLVHLRPGHLPRKPTGEHDREYTGIYPSRGPIIARERSVSRRGVVYTASEYTGSVAL
eukprot:955792-Prorocentrum_minimum.AAC.1